MGVGATGMLALAIGFPEDFLRLKTWVKGKWDDATK